MYRQGDIILVRYPLADKPNKSILRPALVISNEASNQLDKDLLIAQITTNIRADLFSFALDDEYLSLAMPQRCEVRCNKITTIRVWDKLIVDKISAMKPTGLKKVLALVKRAF